MIVALSLVAVAWAGSLVAAFRYGKSAMQARRRAQMGLPPLGTGGIMAMVPALPTTCPACGRSFNRHPATADKRCSGCIAKALDAAEDEDIERLKAQGWGA